MEVKNTLCNRFNLGRQVQPFTGASRTTTMLLWQEQHLEKQEKLHNFRIIFKSRSIQNGTGNQIVDKGGPRLKFLRPSHDGMPLSRER